MGQIENERRFHLKGCAKCGGDLVVDELDWLCLQCGTYYYTNLYQRRPHGGGEAAFGPLFGKEKCVEPCEPADSVRCASFPAYRSVDAASLGVAQNVDVVFTVPWTGMALYRGGR